uniref:(northern house mosquito) hypothetical protein n=1 Tax=Culex pipiens TaxID=7175 RepID=A0A8D8B7Y4_CULPI
MLQVRSSARAGGGVQLVVEPVQQVVHQDHPDQGRAHLFDGSETERHAVVRGGFDLAGNLPDKVASVILDARVVDGAVVLDLGQVDGGADHGEEARHDPNVFCGKSQCHHVHIQCHNPTDERVHLTHRRVLVPDDTHKKWLSRVLLHVLLRLVRMPQNPHRKIQLQDFDQNR